MKTIIHASIIPDQGAGGVETVLLALVSALGKLKGSEPSAIIFDLDDDDTLIDSSRAIGS